MSEAALKQPKQEPVKIVRKIGSVSYEVSVNFSHTVTESLNDKILRLIRNEVLKK